MSVKYNIISIYLDFEFTLRPWAAEIFRPLTSDVRCEIRARGHDKEMVKKTISKSSSTRVHVTGAQLYDTSGPNIS